MRGLFACSGAGGEDVDDDLDDLGDLVIDESPPKDQSVVSVDVNDNMVVDGVGAVASDVDVGPRKDPVMTRSRSRAISAPIEGILTLPPSSVPPSKRSRPSSRSRTSSRTRPTTRSRSRSTSRPSSPSRERPECTPMELPSPPSPKATPELDDAARTEYMKKVELQSKAYIKDHSGHGCLGKKKTSLRPLNCVGRGGLSMSALARWTRGWGGSFAADGGYAEGYYDADDRYYTDPDSLNPPKKKSVVALATNINDPTPSRAGPSSAVVPMEVDANADSVVATYKELSPVLKVPRSFENRPWTRLSKRQKIVKMNIAGIICNVLDDRDPATGRMEDRRSDWTIARKVAAAQETDSYCEMSEDEYEGAMDAKEKLKAKKAEKKARRMEPQRLRAIYANDHDTVVKGDDYIGTQRQRIDKVTLKMAEVMVKQTKDWTAPRLDGQSRPSLQWIDCVDRAGDVDGGHVGGFSQKDPGYHPIDDITLIRATVSIFDRVGPGTNFNFRTIN